VQAPKPELATFRLRRGRAYGGQGGQQRERAPRGERPAKKPYAGFKKDDRKHGDHKDHKGKRPHGGKPRDKDGRPERTFRDNHKDRKGRSDREREDKVIFAAPAATQADSPFAALKQLKMNEKE
jgi:hypothetical protein